MTAYNGTRHMTRFYNETLLSHSSQMSQEDLADGFEDHAAC